MFIHEKANKIEISQVFSKNGKLNLEKAKKKEISQVFILKCEVKSLKSK